MVPILSSSLLSTKKNKINKVVCCLARLHNSMLTKEGVRLKCVIICNR